MDYLLQKISEVSFRMDPFKHIYIENFFNDDDFAFLTNHPQLKLLKVASDRELCSTLSVKGWESISFPGCTNDPESYIQWHSGSSKKFKNVDTCEGFGMAYRLSSPEDERLQSFCKFFSSDIFFQVIAERLDIAFNQTTKDSGIQKYLDGYEISPHPDIRKKAATFMVNINPSPDSASLDYHTHYLRFKPEWQYIREYWAGNPHVDTCWTPWEWCEAAYQQTENNSIVIFSPSESTLHGVKANYNHLPTQRTQIYGNLWYQESPAKTCMPCWEDFLISLSKQKTTSPPKDKLFTRIKRKLTFIG